MEYTFENGVMMGLILGSANNSDSSDDISKIRNPRLRYVLQNGILQGECKLTNTYSEKFFYGFCPLLKQNEANAFVYGNSNYSELKPITINKRYRVGGYYNWYNESRVGDSGIGTKYILQTWTSKVYCRNGTPYGCSFSINSGYSNVSFSWKIVEQYANRDGSGGVVGVYAYPTYAYTDIILTLPDPIEPFTAEYSWTYRYGIDGPNNPNDVNGTGALINASFKKWTCKLVYETYEVTSADGTVTIKNDRSKVPKIYLDPDSMVEYTEARVGNAANTDASSPTFSIWDICTDLAQTELDQMNIEYTSEVLQIINSKYSKVYDPNIPIINTFVNWEERR